MTAAASGRVMRYCVVSLATVPLGQAVLALCFGVLRWDARTANVAAALVATGPAYLLSRRWVWGRQGRSHLLREVLPFWALAFTGLAVSTWLAGVAESVAARAHGLRAVQTAVVMAAVLAGYGVVWVAKFVVLDRVLFADPGRAIDVGAFTLGADPVAAPAWDRDSGWAARGVRSDEAPAGNVGPRHRHPGVSRGG